MTNFEQIESDLAGCELKRNGIVFAEIPDAVKDGQRYKEWFAFMLLKLNEQVGGEKATLEMYNQTLDYISQIPVFDLDQLHTKACNVLISDAECLQKHKYDIKSYIASKQSRKRHANSDVVQFRRMFRGKR